MSWHLLALTLHFCVCEREVIACISCGVILGIKWGCLVKWLVRTVLAWACGGAIRVCCHCHCWNLLFMHSLPQHGHIDLFLPMQLWPVPKQSVHVNVNMGRECIAISIFIEGQLVCFLCLFLVLMHNCSMSTFLCKTLTKFRMILSEILPEVDLLSDRQWPAWYLLSSVFLKTSTRTFSSKDWKSQFCPQPFQAGGLFLR